MEGVTVLFLNPKGFPRAFQATSNETVTIEEFTISPIYGEVGRSDLTPKEYDPLKMLCMDHTVSSCLLAFIRGCFLGSLWAQALAKPQQYAKRAVPTEEEKIKLIVLFEKRATDAMQFDYAELLVDDTNSLISDVQSVAGAAGAAAVGGDLSAYASLFANVDVAQFLSIATEALSSALGSYGQTVYAPTTVVMTTNTYTTVSTIVTNVVNGTLTIPTTYYSTVIRTSVGPVNTERGTRTSHTTETRIGVTFETLSEMVCEITLSNGEIIWDCLENCCYFTCCARGYRYCINNLYSIIL